MAFDWSGNDGTEAPRIREGSEVEVTISKVLYEGKRGKFVSQGGDSQIMLVLSSADGSECATMLTLSEKAGWLLKGILSASGADMDALARMNAKPAWFARKDWGDKLLGRTLRIRVKGYKTDDGNLAEVAPLRRPPAKTAPAPAPGAAPAGSNVGPTAANPPQAGPSAQPGQNSAPQANVAARAGDDAIPEDFGPPAAEPSPFEPNEAPPTGEHIPF